MNYKFLIKLSLYFAVPFTIISCDDDLSTVGGQVIDTIPGNGFTKEEVAVTAYSERLQKVEINGLPGVLLGTNQDERFGSRTHSVLSQVALSSYGPTISETAVFKNITIAIPYFSTPTSASVNDVGETITTYQLDSIRNASKNLKLSIYYSDFFLSDFDENNLENNKVYFSDNTALPPEMKKTLLGTSGNFAAPSAAEVVLPKDECGGDDVMATRIAPQLRIVLDTPEAITLFTERILQKSGDIELSNDNNFKAFFRGILLEVDPESEALLYLNLNTASITLNYTETIDETATEDCDKFEDKAIVLLFSGNTLNLVSSGFNETIATTINAQSKESGADLLYLKGGDGSIGVIKLFSETPQLLEELAADNVIINDALLRVYVDNTMLPDDFSESSLEALQSRHRIYIYNYETGEPLADFRANPQLGSPNPGRSYSNHLGLLQKEGEDYYFDIKLTQHVKNLIYNNEDNENPLLGLCVTANPELPLIATQTGIIVSQNAIKTVDNGGSGATKIPVGSIIDPDGLVVVGNNTPSPKKLKLILTYTQPIN